MAGALAAKTRRLELARGIARDGTRVAQIVGLVWADEDAAALDPGELQPGELLITDYVIESHSPECGPSLATAHVRLTRDAEDYGRVRSYDGREIGKVLRTPRGGIVLEFTWPDGLAASAAPSSSA